LKKNDLNKGKIFKEDTQVKVEIAVVHTVDKVEEDKDQLIMEIVEEFDHKIKVEIKGIETEIINSNRMCQTLVINVQAEVLTTLGLMVLAISKHVNKIST